MLCGRRFSSRFLPSLRWQSGTATSPRVKNVSSPAARLRVQSVVTDTQWRAVGPAAPSSLRAGESPFFRRSLSDFEAVPSLHLAAPLGFESAPVFARWHVVTPVKLGGRLTSSRAAVGRPSPVKRLNCSTADNGQTTTTAERSGCF